MQQTVLHQAEEVQQFTTYTTTTEKFLVQKNKTEEEGEERGGK